LDAGVIRIDVVTRQGVGSPIVVLVDIGGGVDVVGAGFGE
jgi:hypothetical protein